MVTRGQAGDLSGGTECRTQGGGVCWDASLYHWIDKEGGGRGGLIYNSDAALWLKLTLRYSYSSQRKTEKVLQCRFV